MKTTQVQQRFPDAILEAVDNFAASRSMNRTVAINHICQFFLEAIEIEKLRRENKELREKVVRLAMERVPSRGIVPAVEYEHCKAEGVPKPCGSTEPSRCSGSKDLCSFYFGEDTRDWKNEPSWGERSPK